MQRLGQHFLKNRSALERIVAALQLTGGDVVLEIGPGHGELTELLARGKITISSIEKDRLLAGFLREKFAEIPGDIEIIEGDALKILAMTVEGIIKRIGKKNYKLAGNIPYYITGKLLRAISDLEDKPDRTVLLLQREVAERICAEPPRMNRLAASVQFWAEPKIIGRVPREDFSPPPEVDSAIILLKTKFSPAAKIPKETTFAAKRYYAAVRAIFAQPRKTILNNLAAANLITNEKAPKNEIARLLEQVPVSPEARPQNLSVRELAAIAEIFF